MTDRTKILQIGAGSMGTRRLRDLGRRSDLEVALFDPRVDRRKRAEQQFGVRSFDDFGQAVDWGPEALIISTPPDTHRELVEFALDRGLHHFCEASVWVHDYRRVQAISEEKGLISAPSCTFHFLPLAAELKRIVAEDIGALHAYHMCLSTYLPTWHPGEGAEYYARHRSTSGGREMVPFELMFLNEVFGAPLDVAGTVTRRGTPEIDSEDTWSLQMRIDNGATGQLVVLMGCQQLCRRGWCAGTHGVVDFDVITGDVRRSLPGSGINDLRNLGALKVILEAVYAEEIGTFVDVLHGESVWPHDYAASAARSAALAAAERSARSRRVEPVDLERQPGLTPDTYEL